MLYFLTTFKTAIMATENQTAAQGAATIETSNAPISKTKKTPPIKREPKAKKEKTESKRISGVKVHVATITYNNWREYVNEMLNGEGSKRVASFVKDEAALNAKWGGYIATTPENADTLVATLNAWTAENNARPEGEQFVELWTMLEQFQTVEAKPRAPRKAKATAEVA